MNAFILAILATLAALVAPGQSQKEIPGFEFLGSVTSGGIGILSVSNLYVRKDMNTQNGAFASCESAGTNLVTIPDRQKEDQVRLLLNEAGISRIWTGGIYYNARWVWDRYLPISSSANWFGGVGMPGALPNYGVSYRIDNRFDYGLSVVPTSTQMLFVCERPSD